MPEGKYSKMRIFSWSRATSRRMTIAKPRLYWRWGVGGQAGWTRFEMSARDGPCR